MGPQDPFMYERYPAYNRINSSDKGIAPQVTTRESWRSTTTKSTTAIPYQAGENRSIRPDSYVAIPNAHTVSTSLPKKTKKVVKWTTIALLALRGCSWLGAAGLVACLVLIKPVGSFMDWIIRLTPAAALFHVTYAIYYLFWSITSSETGVSRSYMTFVGAVDLCLIPLQVLVAILAHNQLVDPLDNQTVPWQTILQGDYQQHIIVLSTYILALVDAGLQLVSLGVCVFLAVKSWNLARSTSSTTRDETNLTAKRHQKAKNSVSTFMTESSNRDSNASLLSYPNAPGTGFRVLDRKIEPLMNISTPQMTQNRHPNQSSGRPNQSMAHGYRRNDVNPRFSRPKGSEPSVVVEDVENWGTHPPTPPGSPPKGPPELQPLRVQRPHSKKVSPAPLSIKAKYDFSNKSPRPLGLHPPTPRGSTPSNPNAFDVRVLRNIDGNSSAPRLSTPAWHNINLDPESSNLSKEQDDDIVSIGSVARNQARVVSSGTEQHVSTVGVKMRNVSGKAAEEGRAGISYTDF